MNTTENYGLKKPEVTDFFNVEDFNYNSNVIDEKLKVIEDATTSTNALTKNHSAQKNNPHAVTKEQIGLGEVANVSTNNQTPTYATPTMLSALVSGERLATALGKIAKAISELIKLITRVETVESNVENCKTDVKFSTDPLDKQGLAGTWKRKTIYIDDLPINYIINVGSQGSIDLRKYIEEEILDFLVVSILTAPSSLSLYLKETITEMRSSSVPIITVGSRDVEEYYRENGQAISVNHSLVVEVLYKVADN